MELRQFKTGCLLLLLVLCPLLTIPAADAANDEEELERHFETLKVGTLAFTNVWVHRQTNEVILIRHSRGIHSIKLSDLPSEELIELKSQIGDLAELAPKRASGWRDNPVVQKIMGLFGGGSDRTKFVFIAIGVLVVLLMAVKLRKPKDTAG